ncbi:velvet factor-domain-containing protein [Coniella lustricola]|uniref:Velvet factor-domain-containing protein n=1 Tax=Coniella lustricola TaxID=2025994 RepID=A0A2T3ABF4_9PEZI|nr:velvet factor-domain-containing protein [Coniella lustricola]
MASYSSSRAPNGSMPPGYAHQLPPPLHAQSGYTASQPLPSMAPSANGSNFATPAYGQSYQHQQQQHQHQPYQGQQSHPQQSPQHIYHQPPPPGATRHSLSSPTNAGPPQHPSGTSEITTGGLDPVATVVHGRRYALIVEQQPIRARMCGFGDKDRRPLTPPPAIRLHVTDVHTGEEVDVNTIDFAQYVVTVDLWDEHGTKEVNLVRSTTATPAISSTIHESFNNLESMPYRAANIAPYPPSHPSQMPMYGQPPSTMSPYGAQQYGQAVSNYPPVANGYGQPPYGYGGDFAPMYRPPQAYEPNAMAAPQRISMSGPSSGSVQGMFTRNLIGNCAGSAFRLQDTKEQTGIWFVMQDLSVRTEGSFRLRFSFVDVKPPTDMKADGSGKMNKFAIRASVFSDQFQVYSAKKFPGVCDSTELSKCFATQGIKIPIRKEGGKGAADDDDDDE